MKNFGELIREKRQEKGHTIRSLEKALLENQGVNASNSYITLIEKGRRKPTYEIAYAMAKELGITPKTALRAAYQARANFDKNREKEYLLILKVKKKLANLNIEDITK